ncbi:hypothetical protein HMPREF2736_06530 [Corynebacterium sp. HMSC036E10]|uniref:RloB family protein n=1 Tax=Corynebacterium sp. HMSC036E10 TaxID=1715215 RepID=UPI0009112F84|nr:RloB family protein [Corynebacterium sp. HMSC036E10]OHO81429.1 hypothetical protein HMPREF2736_06530 [Corynebacterium sp. HMSC036E10]
MSNKQVRSSREKKFGGKNKRAKTRPVKDVFLIVTEGTTEKNYFEMGCFRDKSVKVEARRGVHPHPPALLKTADDWLTKLKRDGDLRPGDQAWVILDEDDATDQQLQAVFEWAAERKDRGVGFSVPQFEYWLLLHFVDAKGTSSQKDVLDSLMQHWPAYTKTAQPNFTVEEVRRAISRARRKVCEQPDTLEDFDKHIGRHTASTMVHLLAERIITSLYRR